MKNRIQAVDHDSKELSKVPPHTPNLLNLDALDTTTRRAVMLVIHRMDEQSKAAMIHGANLEAILDIESGSLLGPMFVGLLSGYDSLMNAKELLYGFDTQTPPKPWQVAHVGVIAQMVQQ